MSYHLGENNCPSCGKLLSLAQFPDDSGNLDGTFYYYEWTCLKCKKTFRQYYKLVWDENELSPFQSENSGG